MPTDLVPRERGDATLNQFGKEQIEKKGRSENVAREYEQVMIAKSRRPKKKVVPEYSRYEESRRR